jgi:flagellar hook protein FlgE
MMRSMFSAIHGLRNHQTFMDVVGNNIANVNTTGFKESRVTFQDVLSQTLKGGSPPQSGRGGINPEQIGLGVQLGGIDTIQSQGTLQASGKSSDMAIQGDGFFVMSDGKNQLYTRDGAFDLALDGTLASGSNGLHVPGWQADPVTGAIDTTVPAGNIAIPIGAGMSGKASTELTVTGNLDATTAAAGTTSLSSTIFDAQGNANPITLTMTKGATVNTWSVTATDKGGATIGTGNLTFNGSGKIASGGTGTLTLTLTNGATTPQAISLDMSGVTQLAATSDLSSNTDGASAGTLTTFNVGPGGDITGVYSNGYKQPLGQIALATFANPSGLVKTGGNLFQASPNSGVADIGVANVGDRGQISTGFLEGSNVDLAQQFTNMIMAERGFQANSRVITTSDEILQDLVNIKH